MQEVGVIVARDRIMDDIVKKLEKCCHKEICSNKSRGWDLLNSLDLPTKKLASETVKIVNECCCTKLYPPIDTDNNNIKQKFSITWRIGEIKEVKSQNALIGVKENNLETFVMLAQNNTKNDRWINQLPVPNGRIDIYREFENQLFIYELKVWVNYRNTPIYSILEALKNYKILPTNENKETLKKFKINIDTFNTVNLVILAPIKYFVIYNVPDSIKTFFEYIKALEKELKSIHNIEFKVILQAIDFSDTDYEQFCNDLITEINKKEPKRIHRGMEEFNGKWDDYFNILPKSVQANLNCKNWITISSVSDWTSLVK